MTTLRIVESHEYKAALELSMYAFQAASMSEEERDTYLERTKQLAEVWGVFDEKEQLAAKMNLLDFEVMIAGKAFAMGGVASVSTWPEYRRKGYVAQLLQHGLQEMRNKKQSISMLHPFSFAFYRRYGWETYIEYKQYGMSTQELPKIKQIKGSMERIMKPLDEWASLNNIYATYIQHYTGMLVRPEPIWKFNVLEDKGLHAAVYRNDAGEQRGYILYKIEKSKFIVDEMIFLDEEAREQLWKYICQHDSMVKEIEWSAPIDDYFTQLIDNPRIKQEVKPYFMARIVDVEQFVTQYPFEKTGKSHDITIKIEDDVASWNDHVFDIHISENGVAQIEQVVDVAEQKDIITVSIQSLTSMMMGYQTVDMLTKTNRLQGPKNTIEVLKQVIPSQTTYLSDFF
ncbi:GNAT family N-acetyltransferase [Longirhabdus pacifica]|uniref:GNAT family N-acetyltransferase n=1 Tax=Longirhabdus pacifica TaxID=2305227 RepID=UPI001008B730|nr:GNAT family N-acetyltransferase [Longirhabdus pacifica]